jgi:hypothetical protein
MSDQDPLSPLELGQVVCRRSDTRARLTGLVVGFSFVPIEAALVRWGNAEVSLEPLDALIGVLKLFG